MVVCKCSLKTFTPVNPSKLGGVTVTPCQWLASNWCDQVSSSSYSNQDGAVWVAIGTVGTRTEGDCDFFDILHALAA